MENGLKVVNNHPNLEFNCSGDFDRSVILVFDANEFRRLLIK